VNNLWWAPLVVLIAYTPACIVMFPRPLITLFAVIAFGPWLGALYGLTGVLIAALVTYFAGRMMKKAVVYKLAGSRLNHVTEILRKRGLIAVTALRIVPVAPFSIINLVAGAIRIKLWHFMLGSVIGLLPGTIATIVFGAQLETALRDPSKVNYWLVAGVAALFAVGIWLVRRVVFGGAFSRPPTAEAAS
jgi:phospholipase D1/2